MHLPTDVLTYLGLYPAGVVIILLDKTKLHAVEEHGLTILNGENVTESLHKLLEIKTHQVYPLVHSNITYNTNLKNFVFGILELHIAIVWIKCNSLKVLEPSLIMRLLPTINTSNLIIFHSPIKQLKYSVFVEKNTISKDHIIALHRFVDARRITCIELQNLCDSLCYAYSTAHDTQSEDYIYKAIIKTILCPGMTTDILTDTYKNLKPLMNLNPLTPPHNVHPTEPIVRFIIHNILNEEFNFKVKDIDGLQTTLSSAFTYEQINILRSLNILPTINNIPMDVNLTILLDVMINALNSNLAQASLIAIVLILDLIRN
jgi:hypothetical protein